MSALQKILCTSIAAPSSSRHLLSKCFLILPLHFSFRFRFPLTRQSLPAGFACSISISTMPRRNRGMGKHSEGRWIQKPNPLVPSSSQDNISAAENVVENPVIRSPMQFGSVAQSKNAVWKPMTYGTQSRGATLSAEKPVNEKSIANLSKLFDNFSVNNSTYSLAQIRAAFYPKFENEKSDQEIRTRMIEMVSKGIATVEVSLKHSGSLFMYAGHEGGAYAKNSYGNIYTAVGVFVLGRMFREAWGTRASQKQAEFNDFLERNHMCISMELVTAVLGDHGQRPQDDYVVVTAVTDLGAGKPKFYSTAEIIAFCRKWRLPTNHVWLLSTRKSVTSFFAAYDALCEEGTATPVCRTLDEVANISIPGSKDHTEVQGEILEGLVARIVSHDSLKHLEQVLKDFPLPPLEGVGLDLGPNLREICAANRSEEKQQIKALLQEVGTSFCPKYLDWFGIKGSDSHSRNVDQSVLTKFLQSHPADFSTTKLQEMIRLMKEKRFPAAFKFYNNFHKTDSTSSDNVHMKMVVHVHSDSTFRRYQQELRRNPGLWPLYRGFFVDINLSKAGKQEDTENLRNSSDPEKSSHDNGSAINDLADDDANLMIKLKFLTYKIRTFLIRNGLSILFKEGPGAYKAYYQRQMKIWNTSPGKQKQLSKLLDEWAVYIRRKYGNKQLSSSTYLSEAEPFLEQYAKKSLENQTLIGSAGYLVRSEDFMAIVDGGRDEGDLETEKAAAPSSPRPVHEDTVPKDEGLIIFFPGIPGCAKSALCREIVNATGGLGDDRPIHSLMGDLIKGKYWDKVDEQRRSKPRSIVLADKNAPNEEVWMRIEGMCRKTKASAIPVIPDSEGTETNPFSLDALAVFIYRVLQRVNHPGNLDKDSPNAGYVLLMFYDLYDSKSRTEFEAELIERFGSVVKMPLLKPNRRPLPDSIKSVIEEGISLYNLHKRRHRKLDSTKGSYANDWVRWETKLRQALFSNAEYLDSVQVPFESAVEQVLEQLRTIMKGEYKAPTSTQKRAFGNIIYAAITFPVSEIINLLNTMGKKNPKVGAFLKDANIYTSLKQAHMTLAHKRSHGVPAVANYGPFVGREVPVDVTALVLSNKLAAFETLPGSVDGETIPSRNEWPHVTLWTAQGIPAKEANTLPQLISKGEATRIEIDPPFNITGVLEFH